MRDAVICMPLRTPVGRYGGSLKDVEAEALAGFVIKAVVERSGIDPSVIEDCIMGQGYPSGESPAIGRTGVLRAGLPIDVPGTQVDRRCASGLQAICLAAMEIQTGGAAVVLAGGVESMTRAPWVMAKPESLPPKGVPELVDSSFGWRFVNPRLSELHPPLAMGETAENLVDKYDITREEQDAFALRSHQRAVAAWDDGTFDAEVVGVNIPGRKGAVTSFDRDEGPRPDASLESLAKLRPVFRNSGSVTAGNASSLNDGAAAVLVASEDAVRRHGLQPVARIVSSGVVGVNPSIMGIGPVDATNKALTRAGWSAEDLDSIELNEAFAAQCLAVLRELPVDPEIVNPQGGAIAIGHPLGSTGARLVTTLLHRMRRDATMRRGLVTLCIGVGQGQSLLVEAAG